MSISRRRLLTSAVFAGSACLVENTWGADWARFRGPNGTGVAESAANLPATFSATENLQWKTQLPGPGSSCPILIGDKVIVTCWSGYGMERGGEAGSQKDLKRHVVCVDRKSGKTVWDTSVDPYLPEDSYRGMFAEHGYASHTPTSDGKRIFAFFGKSGACAFDMDGKKLWQTPLGTESDRRGWGSASSPVLFGDLVIVTASAESQALVALNQETGKEVWRKEASGFEGTWGTPVLVKVDDNRTDLVLAVPGEIWGFNPLTGKLLWFCEAMDSDSFCSSLVANGDELYAIEGRGGGSIAVRAGGDGDVTKSHILWKGRHTNRICTPLYHDGLLYFISSGIVNCIEAKTGNKVYQTRLSAGGGDEQRPRGGQRGGPGGGFGGFGGGGRGGQDYSSPVAADGKLYFISRGGDVHVVKLGPKFEHLATNRLTDATEDFSASPAIGDRQIIIRSSKHLYCVGESK